MPCKSQDNTSPPLSSPPLAKPLLGLEPAALPTLHAALLPPWLPIPVQGRPPPWAQLLRQRSLARGSTYRWRTTSRTAPTCCTKPRRSRRQVSTRRQSGKKKEFRCKRWPSWCSWASPSQSTSKGAPWTVKKFVTTILFALLERVSWVWPEQG